MIFQVTVWHGDRYGEFKNTLKVESPNKKDLEEALDTVFQNRDIKSNPFADCFYCDRSYKHFYEIECIANPDVILKDGQFIIVSSATSWGCIIHFIDSHYILI